MLSCFLANFFPPSNSCIHIDNTQWERSPEKASGTMSTKIIHYLFFLLCGNFNYFSAGYVNLMRLQPVPRR